MTTTRNNLHIEIDTYRLGHHLRIAYEQYVENAKFMREAGHERVAEEFDRLAQQAQDWADIFQHDIIDKVIVGDVSSDSSDRLYLTYHEVY